MSTKYPGGVISKTAPTPAGPYANDTAPGIWTLEQQAYWQKLGQWPTQGNVNPSAFIENLFSTYLYTGNETARSITNGIDLSTKGGMVWIKDRGNAIRHAVFDSARGSVSYLLIPNSTAVQNVDITNNVTSFNADGFSLGTGGNENGTGRNYVSWTFREQPKFFDIVTWTGTGANRTIAHNLGAVPGCIIVKRLDTAEGWAVYHRSLANTQYLILNDTAAAPTGATFWNSTTPTSSVFSVGTNAGVNASGGTYVAYIFAHDAGGFGLSGTDNVISCGSYVGNGLTAGPQVTLGWEPQWVLRKNASNALGGPTTDGVGAGAWSVVDNMRGMSQTTCPFLFANSSAAEDASTVTTGYIIPNATGFVDTYTNSGDTYIYIAIRRGPMKVPTLGTSVFAPVLQTGNGTGASITTAGFAPDSAWVAGRDGSNYKITSDKLIGTNRFLQTVAAAAEVNLTSSGSLGILSWDMKGVTYNGYSLYSGNGNLFVYYLFGRAPGFFDEVCYTGTGVARTITHNLAAVPELMIVKNRNNTNDGRVYTASGGTGFFLRLFSAGSMDSGNTAAGTLWNSTTPTSSVFSVDASNFVNGSGYTYVAYLFATCAGVSKVGSYAGTGSTQTINCGFTGGARFVLIKKSTSTAPDRDWYVWDTARGMVSGTDPSLKINTTAAEVNADDVYTITTGFQLVSSSDYVNASGVTYIFLAIA